MGYTIEKGKAVIWTSKVFEADPYPFNDDGDNYTYFYKNLYDRDEFTRCLTSLSDDRKMEIVSKMLDLPIGKFILKSKKSHNKQKQKHG